MIHRVSRLVLALAVFPLCAAAQTWTATDASTVSSNCTTPPCKVVINPGNTTNNTPAIDSGGPIVVRGSSPFVGLYSSSGPAAYSLDAPANQTASILMRSGNTESVYLRREPTSNDFTIWTSVTERMRITAAGRVGIGTNNPPAILGLYGPDGTSQQTIGRTSGGGVMSTYVSNSDAMSTGFDADIVNGVWYARHTTSFFLTKAIGKFIVYGSAGNTVNTPAINIRSLFDIDVTTADAHFLGKVAIGTAPTANALEVAGNANFSGTVTGGNIRAQYQDVAEWVPATGDMTAGTVVVLNERKTNEVRPSTTAYDTRVAGVVSARPGLLLGEGGDNKAMIATTGRVRVKVDATQHPIHIGDLLVTSAKPGTAMVSEPLEISGRQFHQPGTVVGKALEPLESGQGEILVLLSLQ